MASITTVKLNTGATIPALGFGTWQDKDSMENAVLAGLKAGYRHIDTAAIYQTEEQCGKGIKDSGIPRDEIFLTTKLWNDDHHQVEAALDKSLKKLGTEYVDLYLMHWPCSWETAESKTTPKNVDYITAWKDLEKVFKSGKARAIGISNFSKAETEKLLAEATVVPAVHQLECHPYLQQTEFVKWTKSKGIQVTAYSPFGNQNEIYGSGDRKLIEDPVILEIGKKYGKSGAQVTLAWGINRGEILIPKSKSPERLAHNLEGDFKLDDEDMAKLAKLDKKQRFNDPSGSFKWKFYADLDGSS